MFGRIDRHRLERAMRQLGVKAKELEGVREVVIKLADKEIVLPNAQVTLVETPVSGATRRPGKSSNGGSNRS